MSALAALFTERGRRRFLARHWPDAHEHLFHHGPAARLRGITDHPALQDLSVLLRHHRMIRAQHTRGPRSFVQAVIEPEQYPFVSELGVPVTFEGIQRTFPDLARWATGLATELGLPPESCSCSVFVSPPGTGFDKHFDGKDIFVIGLVGRKDFHIAPNTDVANPTQNGGPTFRTFARDLHLYAKPPFAMAMPRRAVTCTVRPGSVLFLPRGYWHATIARGGASWSLSIAFQRPTYAEIAAEHLRCRLLADPRWRRPIPPPLVGRTRNLRAVGELDALLAELAAKIAELDASTLLRASGDA